MEFQNGLIAGLKREIADKKYPKPEKRYLHTKSYEMESDLEFRYRAENFMSKVINENSMDENIAIISHGGTINMLFRSFMSLPIDSNYYLSTSDTGIHRWYIDNDKRVVVYSNNTSHLLGII